MISRILVPVDIYTPKTTERLCQQAAEIATKFDAQIQLLAVLPDYGTPLVGSFFPAEARNRIKAEFKDKISELADIYFSKNKVSLKLRQGKKFLQILQEEECFNPDLIMIGCRRKKSRNNQRLLGSCSSSVADRAVCSVFIVRSGEF